MLKPRDCRQRSTPMASICGPQLVFLGPPFAVLGAWAFYLGVQAWRRPNSRLVQSQLVEGYPTREEADPISRFLGLTRERAGPRNVTVARFLGPFNGSIFVLVGCWMTYTGLTCGPTYPSLVSAIRPLIGPLALRFHPTMLVWVGLAVLISSMSAWRKSVTARIVWLILGTIWAVAAYEAAWFHVGTMANRWGVIAFGLPIVVSAVAAVWWLIRKAQKWIFKHPV